jgi:chemotaxis protein MotB
VRWQRRRKGEDHDEIPEYWITYSDLMVSLLMAFVLLLLLALGRFQAEAAKAEGIIKANRDAFRIAGDALATGGGHAISLDTLSGTLTMSSELLFGYGSAQLRPEARSEIEQIATKFIPQLLSRPSVDTMIQEIVVEGHTDTVGSYMSNLQLSQARAYSVMRAMIDSTYGKPYAARLQTLITASGKSEVKPIITDDTIDARRSRRIEIHIRFRDDAILKSVLRATRGDAFRAHP